MEEKLFRKKALERLTSPEQLDVLLTVTPVRAWLVLVALAGLVGVAVFWGITGTIPISVSGQGILVRGEGVDAIEAPASGQIVALTIEAGDIIGEGQIIAELVLSEGGEATTIASPFGGRILEVRVSDGAYVQVGTTLASLEPVDEPLEAILYVSPTDGKNIRQGMTVHLSPTTVKPEEYGFMLGQVKSVSQFPATSQGMLRVLGSEELVRELSSGGSPIEVRVELSPAEANPSGYEWTSPQGPPILIQSGTFVTGEIILRKVHPIDMVFIRQ
jgi:hypothetical protein